MDQSFVPVGGTPLIPPSYLTVYLVLFLILLSVLYVYFYRRRRPVLLWHKVRLFIVLGVILKTTAVLGGGLVAAYWLIPAPNIRRTLSGEETGSFDPTGRIEIVFDKPVNRYSLEKSISPETPGIWVFENSLYTTHLYRKLVFYPTFSLKPDTTFTVKLRNISNLIGVSKPYDYQFEFKTQPSPKVASVIPLSGQKEVEIDSKITVTLDNPNNGISDFEFQFSPGFEYDEVFDPSKNTYVITPKTSLDQGTQYSLKIQRSDIISNLEDKNVVERSASMGQYEGSFTTKEAPGIVDFKPEGDSVSTDSEILITFSKRMDKQLVTENLTIDPATEGKFTWIDDTNLSFKPDSLDFKTDYKVSLAKGVESLDGGFLEEELVKSFKTIGNAKVSQFNPENSWSGVNIKSPIKVDFDQEVEHVSAQEKFSIQPDISGTFSWEGNTMVFTPEKSLGFTTNYTVTIASGIESVKGLDSEEEFRLTFSTQDQTTKLAVPVYLQKYTLSCEIASLRMALNFKGANVSEDELIPLVGQDPTQHNGNVWGNPYNAFVGNIKGTQMVDGYGVYWGPIAKAARNYRQAQEFQGWNIDQLTNEISKGNPVVIWVYSHYGTQTSWKTPDGTTIYAVRDEHAVVAVGFVGSPENPNQIIINDPLSGQVYWSRASFDKKWNIFGRSGVVVF